MKKEIFIFIIAYFLSFQPENYQQKMKRKFEIIENNFNERLDEYRKMWYINSRLERACAVDSRCVCRNANRLKGLPASRGARKHACNALVPTAQGFLLFTAARKVNEHMSKNLENKKQVVADILEKLQKAQSVVIVHYSGITVENVTKLRNQFREAGVEYVVLKNKLVERALNELNIEGLNEQLTGPNAYAFGMTDAVAPAKVIYDFISKNKKDESNLSVKAGLMGTEVMDVNAVKALSEVPSRDVLLARLVGSIHAPVSNLVYALEAIRKQKAGEDAE